MFVPGKGPIRVWLLFTAVLVGTGCTSEPTGETKTEQLRRTLDPRVKNFLALGQEAVRGGAYRQALALADSAEAYEPELADVYLLRGTVYTVMNRLAAAQEEYETVIALDPAYPGVRQSMGDNALKLGQPREALRRYREEEAVNPTAPLYAGMGRVYDELGALDSARTAYETAIALDSTDAGTYVLYGRLLEKQGALDSALAYSRKALALRPDNAHYRFIVGAQLYRSGQTEEAVAYLRQAADSIPLHYPARYNLGQALARLGRREESDRYLAEADSIQELLHQITLAEEAATRNPDAVENWARLGDLFHTSGLYDRALEAFSVATALDPSNLALHHAAAQAAMAAGQPAEAARRFQAILRADSTRTTAWVSLGVAYATAGNCPEARRAWETALRHRPGDATASAYLARACRPAVEQEPAREPAS